MIEIDFSSYDLNNPRQRRALLLKIPPSREVVRKYHAELLDLFRREMTYRRADRPAEGDDESDYFENLYWCGLLLYLVGDPADVPLMWEAKNINMDTGSGFDAVPRRCWRVGDDQVSGGARATRTRRFP